MNNVIINLQSCRGTEAPYVMASCAHSLDGLLILRPFNQKRICCIESEDACQEHQRLKILNLLTLSKFGAQSKKDEASEALREFHGDQFEITKMIPKDIGTMLASVDPETALQTWQRIFEEHTTVIDARCMVPGPKHTLQHDIRGEDDVEQSSTENHGVTTSVNTDDNTIDKSISTSSIGRKRPLLEQTVSIPNSKRQRHHKQQ